MHVVTCHPQVVTCPSTDMIRTRARCRADDHWVDCYRLEVMVMVLFMLTATVMATVTLMVTVMVMVTMMVMVTVTMRVTVPPRDSCCPGHTLVVGRCLPEGQDPCR